MAHCQSFANTSSSKNNVKRLARQTTTRYCIKHLNVEWDSFFNSVVEVESLLIILQEVVTDVRIKRNSKSSNKIQNTLQ